ncbi:MAG: magnesium transporter CorA family protein [Chthoniobacterales bacterium]
MISFYAPGQPGRTISDPNDCALMTPDAVWIDLLEPTTQEELALEAALGVDIPTREEMQAIELSSRLYEENGLLFMTATVMSHSETNRPQSSAVTFIYSPHKLITLRYSDPAPFNAFRVRREANVQRYQTPGQFLGGIIDSVIERVADILEGVGLNLDHLSVRIFDSEETVTAMPLHTRLKSSPHGRARKARQRNFVEVLREIGIESDRVSRARESLVSFARLVAYYREMRHDDSTAREAAAHLKTISGDLTSLSDHATFLSSKVSFLLDATLGMINNEQNAIIKILSVAALVFLPPTLVAGIYGMNFTNLPELHWAHGYPWALFLMIVSAVVPYLFFKRRGWL